MKKLFIGVVTMVILIVITTNYGELYAMFFNKFSKETSQRTANIDFTIDGDFAAEKQIKLDQLGENDEMNLDIDFDIKNDSDCDIYVRVAILPVVLDSPPTNTSYKFSKSLCEIQYDNENNNNPDDEYWQLADDGYYYHKKSIKKGGILENKLISGVKLKPSKSEIMDLADKQVQIVVKVEAKSETF